MRWLLDEPGLCPEYGDARTFRQVYRLRGITRNRRPEIVENITLLARREFAALDIIELRVTARIHNEFGAQQSRRNPY